MADLKFLRLSKRPCLGTSNPKTTLDSMKNLARVVDRNVATRGTGIVVALFAFALLR